MKKIAIFVLAIILILPCILMFTSCDAVDDVSSWVNSKISKDNDNDKNNETRNTITLPDLSETDASVAKTILSNKGLIPKVEYEYNNNVEEGLVIKTNPEALSSVYEDDIITVYVSKGKSFYEAKNCVGYMTNVTGIDSFSWGSDTEEQTKAFLAPYVSDGYLYVHMILVCKSDSDLAFYGNFASASLNENFLSSVPSTLVGPYDFVGINTFKQEIDNTGNVATEFCVKIPLESLGTKKPNNIYIKLDILVDNVRQTFKAGFDIAW